MPSRDEILANIRRTGLEPTAHPGLQPDAIRFVDREQQFIETLASVGGAGHLVEGLHDVERILQALPCILETRHAVCLVPDLQLNLATTERAVPATPDRRPVDRTTVAVEYTLQSSANAHDLANVDLAIIPGDFAVAENAAVWVDSELGAHRSLPFLTQHLVLVVRRSDVVDNMFDAYQRLSFPRLGYGIFISGPSKTADIEQSLVIGAHGPRSLHVILY